ncbi:hypothetical protein ACE6H2_010730 [Prunus campanulata]
MIIHGFSNYLVYPSIKIGKKDRAHGHLVAIHKYFPQGLKFFKLAQPHYKKNHMLSVGYAIDGRGVGGLSAMAKISLHPTPESFVRLVEI